MPSARSHRLADRHFFRSIARTDQEKIDQIYRPNEQQEKHPALHQQKWRTNGTDVIRMQRNHQRAKAGFGHHFRLRIIFLDGGVVCIDLGLRFRDRRARLQPRDHVRDAAARVARFRPTLFHTGFYRKKNACLGREKTKSRRQDANDLSWDTVYAGVTTENVWIRIEILPPEGVRQDNYVFLRVGFFIGEVATDHGTYPKGREKFRRDAHDFLLLHGARITDGFGSLHIHGKAREGRDIAAPLVVIGYRRAVVLDTGFRIRVVNRD